MLTLLYVLLVFILVFANGFFVASEFALVGVRRSRIATLAAAGNRRAKVLLELLDHLNAYISATQLGITMASLALGWIGEPVFAHLLEGPLAGRVSQRMLDTIAFAVALHRYHFPPHCSRRAGAEDAGFGTYRTVGSGNCMADEDFPPTLPLAYSRA